MPSFVDANGKTWTLRVSVQSAFDLKQDGAVDLFAVMENAEQQIEFFQSLFTAPEKAVRIVYVLCQREIEAAALNEESFCDSLDGAALRQIPPALMEAIGDFFPAGHKEVAQRIAAQIRKEVARVDAMNMAKLKGMNLEVQMTKEVDRLISTGRISTGSVATLERTRRKSARKP